MKIISKFNDYYDGGLIYGIDDNIFFKRKKKIIMKHYKISTLKKVEHILDSGYVKFCNEIYKFLVYRKSKVGYILPNEFNSTNSDESFYYNYNDFINEHPEFNKNKSKYSFDFSFQKYFDNEYYIGYHPLLYNIEQIEQIFKPQDCYYYIYKNYNDIDEMNGKYIETHGILKNVKFNKVLDCFKAFQELSMFILSKNNIENKDIISEHDRFVAHGMDKTSFRNV